MSFFKRYKCLKGCETMNFLNLLIFLLKFTVFWIFYGLDNEISSTKSWIVRNSVLKNLKNLTDYWKSPQKSFICTNSVAEHFHSTSELNSFLFFPFIRHDTQDSHWMLIIAFSDEIYSNVQWKWWTFLKGNMSANIE